MTSRSDADELKDASQKLLEEKAVNSINVGDDSDDSRVKSLQSKSETAGVEIIQDVDAPHPPAQHIATSFPSLEVIKDDNSSSYATAAAPLPIEHIVAAMEAFDDNIDGISAIKSKIHSNASAHQVNSDADDNEVHDTRVESSNARVYSSTPSGNDEEQAPLRPNNNVRRQGGVKGSTTSTSMSMDEATRHLDVDQDQDGVPALTVLEATLVDDKVYDAIPFEMNQENPKVDEKDDVAHSPHWYKSKARLVLVGLITVALTATIIVIIRNNINKGSNEQDTTKVRSNNSVWIEQGHRIIGTESHDKFGIALTFSADGSVLAIGASGSYSDMNQKGYVKAYRISVSTGVSWKQIGEDIRGIINGDNFGGALALSADGKILAVGAPAFGAEPEDKMGMPGYSRIYYLVEDDASIPSWQQIGKDVYGEAAGDNFGTSISLSGDGKTVAIGSMRGDKNGTVLDSGRVSIYQIKDEGDAWTTLGFVDDNGGEPQSSSSGWILNAKSNWTQLGQDIFGEATEDSAGYSLSLTTDGGTVAVGSPFNSGPNRGFSSGQVRLFSFDAVASSWVQNELNMTGVGRNDQFGFFVATSADGETLAMGAPAFEAGRPGYVKVASLKNGQQIGQIIEGKTIEGEFGSAISLSEDGKTIAVSDPDQGNGLGSVSVFKFKASNSTWVQHGEAIEGENTFDYFGYAVALSGDGKILAIGTPYDRGNGTVRIFFDRTKSDAV